MRRLLFGWLIVGAVSVFAAEPLTAQQLPMRRYGTADGLAHNAVNHIFQDRMGYLWVATNEGLSRFDGYRFHNYGVPDGLANPFIRSTLEDMDGRLWAQAQHSGIALLDDRAPRDAASPLFRNVLVDAGRRGEDGINRINTAVVTPDGTFWAVSGGGLYRGRWEHGDLRFSFETTVSESGGSMQSFLDSRGRAWLLLDRHLAILDGPARTVHGVASGLGDGWTAGMTEGPDGRIYVVNDNRLRRFVPSTSASTGGTFVVVDVPQRQDEALGPVLLDRRGRLWLGTSRRLLMSESGQPGHVRPVNARDMKVNQLFEDRESNIWVGTTQGLYRIAAGAAVTYATGRTEAVVESAAGRIYATTLAAIVEIDPAADTGASPVLVPDSEVGPRLLASRSNDLWFGTRQSLYVVRGFRFGGKVPERVAGPWPLQGWWLGPALHEDAAGTIWASTPDELLRITPTSSGTPAITSVRFEKTPTYGPVGRMISDHTGAIWTGEHARLGRVRNGVPEIIAPRQGLREILPRALLVDRRGWVWVGLRYGGVAVTRNPSDAVPAFTFYSTGHGLSSETVWCMAENRQGRLFFGTGRGLDSLDVDDAAPDRVSIQPVRGVEEGPIDACFIDRGGSLWFNTSGGLSRLDFGTDSAPPPPPVYLTAITVGNRVVPLQERGVVAAPELRLSAAENSLAVEFVALTFVANELVRYQYRLRPDDEWSSPQDWRAIALARLAPGRYAFQVRAVGGHGEVGAAAAGFAFEVLPPFWQRWWFVVLMLAALAAPTYALHRARVRRILAVEGVRRQVALDLHDDIGSGLAQIAVLGEVARQRAIPEAQEGLGEIAGLARGLRESMSDIVWAVDPRKDRLTDVVQRLKHVAYNLFEVEGVRVDFQCPSESVMDRVALASDRRRHVLLLFKEAMSNAARHGAPTSVQFHIEVSGRTLAVRLKDDGRGFDSTASSAGHGLDSMRRRATLLGARLNIASAAGGGTFIEMELDL